MNIASLFLPCGSLSSLRFIIGLPNKKTQTGAVSNTSCSFSFFQVISQNTLFSSFSPKHIQCIGVAVNHKIPVTHQFGGKNLPHSFPCSLYHRRNSLCFAFQINMGVNENASKTMLQLLWQHHLIFFFIFVCGNSKVPSQEGTSRTTWLGTGRE